MPKALATDPRHEYATKQLSYWVKDFIDHFNARSSTNASCLSGKDATSSILIDRLAKENPKLVLLSGHGNENNICGFNDEVLIGDSVISSVASLRGKIVHSLACEAGKSLGFKLVRSGTQAFIGYKEKFKFNSSANHDLSINEHDPIADLFLEPAYLPAKAMSSGKTAEEAVKESKALYAKNLSAMLALNNPSAMDLAANLFHDLTHQVLIGDTSAKM